jgi:hypothetical protein
MAAFRFHNSIRQHAFSQAFYHAWHGSLTQRPSATSRNQTEVTTKITAQQSRNQVDLNADFADFADENSAHRFLHCHYPCRPRIQPVVS